MKCPALKESVLISLIIILPLVDTSQGDPRSEIIKLACSQKLQNNESMYIPNFEQTMEKISSQIKSTKSGTASTGSGPDSSYGLAECYDDLSMKDCMLCYAQAQTALHMCLPSNGGRVFLDGCFMRTQNYNFYQEYEGVDYTVICGNTKRSRVFRDSVRQAISDVVRDAPRSRDYFARKQEISYAVANDSAYVLADCWNTLNESSCTECLESAFPSILKCFPSSEGRALHTGCFLRYSNTNFLNPEPTEIDNGGNSAALYQNE
ncbi:putative non-specific serine/threonine protein kinase [Helianthus debilis subsp. tardiflorus]